MHICLQSYDLETAKFIGMYTHVNTGLISRLFIIRDVLIFIPVFDFILTTIVLSQASIFSTNNIHMLHTFI